MNTADIDTVKLWCLEQASSGALAPGHLEPLVTGRHIDLAVVRVSASGEATRTPVARLRFLNSGLWQIYWRDAEGSFQVYRNLPAVEDVQDLLDFLAADPDPLFWPDEP